MTTATLADYLDYGNTLTTEIGTPLCRTNTEQETSRGQRDHNLDKMDKQKGKRLTQGDPASQWQNQE